MGDSLSPSLADPAAWNPVRKAGWFAPETLSDFRRRFEVFFSAVLACPSFCSFAISPPLQSRLQLAHERHQISFFLVV
jgi:hypothetical protein